MAIAAQVGELLAAAPNLAQKPGLSVFADTVAEYIDQALDGNAAALGHIAGVHHKTVYLWRDGEQTPTLSTLLRLSQRIGTTPLDLLSGRTLVQMPQRSPMHEMTTSAALGKRYRRFNPQAVRQRLLDVLADQTHPPQPMGAVARDLGYDHSFLIARFPDLTRRISDRYAAHVAHQREQSTARPKNNASKRLCSSCTRRANTPATGGCGHSSAAG